MIQFILIAAIAWVVGIIGWAQIIGSLQNLSHQKNLLATLLIWIVLLALGAFVAIVKMNSLLPLAIGYGLSFLQILASGKIS